MTDPSGAANESRGARIAVVSDTHGVLRSEVLARIGGCDLIVHAGDVGDPEILERLRA